MNTESIVIDTPLDYKRGDGLSYKFQRLRERVRAAVVSGELAGKLPGERTLAKRFQVNAKTLSKALTDLAAEGLLDRSIGRGTYVKSASPAGATAAPDGAPDTAWLVVCEADRPDDPAVRAFLAACPAATTIHDVAAVRPSFLKQFEAVLDFGRATPEAFVRGLVVRNMPIVAVDREPGTFSVNAVCADRALAAANLTRDLCLAGHRRFAVLQSVPRGAFVDAIKSAAARCGPDAAVHPVTLDQLLPTIRAGHATAVLCDCPVTARRARQTLESAGLRLPHDVSLAAVGSCDAPHPCSGQYASAALLAQTTADLLKSGPPHRPTTLWLAPTWVDNGTTGAPPASTI